MKKESSGGCKPYVPVTEQLTVPKTIRFTQAQYKEFEKRGGADWLRKQLDKVKK